MKPYSQIILNSLRQIFSAEASLEAKIKALMRVGEHIASLDAKERKKLFDYLDNNKHSIANSQQILFKSFLFFTFRDKKLLESLAKELFKYTDSLETYHCLVWNIMSNLFQYSGEVPADSILHIRENLIRPSYQKVLENISNQLQDTKNYKHSGQLNKVGLVINQFLGLLHAPTRNALLLAAGLFKQHGITVQVINANLFPIDNCVGYYTQVSMNYHEGFKKNQLFKYEDPEYGLVPIHLYTQEPQDFNIHSLVGLWNYIENENFDALINLGDTLFATDYFYKKIPILNVNTIRQLPISLADQFLLSHDHLNNAEESIIQKLGTMPPALGWNVKIAPEKGDSLFSKKDFGIPDNAFVFVVVGNRLSQEIESQFIEVCRKLIAQNENTHILFVGNQGDTKSLLEQSNLAQTNRVQSIDFQPDLRAFYSICNIYLNPFRAGGNISAQMALLEKVPVLTLAEGDVATCLPPALRCKNIEEYTLLATRLSQDSIFYDSWKEQICAIGTSLTSNKDAINRLYHLLQALINDHSTNSESSKSLTA